MSLIITQLNGDSSFLLSFEPIVPFPTQEPFRILLDPWIPGPGIKVDPREAYATSYDHLERESRRISSLKELPEPDLVIISQEKSDHCNKATLKQLPGTNTKTQIWAEPSAAKLIRSWKHFAKGKVQTLEKWEDPRVAKKETTIRIPIPPESPSGDPGEVTISLITQKRDHWRLHSAIGITYRPPPSRPMSFNRPSSFSQPTTPKGPLFNFRLPSPPPLSAGIANLKAAANQTFNPLVPPPTPPESPRLQRPRSCRSMRSIRSVASVSPQNKDRSLSVIFSPHGITYRSLELYTTTHLVTEAALPLTALIHCFDSAPKPWWLPDSITSGSPDGQQIASKLGAKAWISAHDAARKTPRRKWMARKARTHRYRKDEVRQELEKAAWDNNVTSKKKTSETELLVLQVTDEVTLTNEGVFEMPDLAGKPRASSMVF
jgi:hypothetical protein